MIRKPLSTVALAAAGLMLCGGSAFAESHSGGETGFMLHTLVMLIGAILVFWMSAGFTMLEAGLVRSKNVATQITKNIGLFAVAGISFLLVGYSFLDPSSGWTIPGVLSGAFPSIASAPPVGSFAVGDVAPGPAKGGSILFALMFCAATASIVSGTLAERLKILPFLIFTAVLTGIIYPLQASWTWSGGFLASIGFLDFAGSTVVHSVGGWAALAGALVVGPRVGKFTDGRVNPMPGSSLPLSTIGVFILWMGWFGFNGASLPSINDAADFGDLARVFLNTNSAALGGAIVAMIATQLMFGKIDLTVVLNGALGGLVSITADPLSPAAITAVLVGGVGGGLVVLVVPLLDKIRVDDVVGAIAVHLVCGIWGTLAIVISNDNANFVSQVMGIVVVAAFVFPISFAIWIALRFTIGVRVDPAQEVEGLDIAELGMEAYPDFVQYGSD